MNSLGGAGGMSSQFNSQSMRGAPGFGGGGRH